MEKVSSSKVRERLFLEGSALTSDKAIRITTQVEKCQREVQFTSGDSACVHEVRKKDPHSAMKKSMHFPKTPFKSGATCFRC